MKYAPNSALRWVKSWIVIAGVACGTLAVAHDNDRHAQDLASVPHTRDMWVRHFERIGDGCIGAAPITSEIQFTKSAAAGGTITATMTVATMDEQPDAKVSVTPSSGIQMAGSAKAVQVGKFEKDKPYTFSYEFTASGAGLHTVYVRAECGTKSFRMWRGHTLYVNVANDGSMTVTDVKPETADDQVIVRAPLRSGKTTTSPLVKAMETVDGGEVEKHLSPPCPDVEIAGTGNGNDVNATTTINGNFYYDSRKYGYSRGAYGTNVEVWDKNSGFPNQMLAQVAINYDGSYSISFSNNETWVFDGGTADVYLVFRAKNGRTAVVNSGGNEYWNTTENVGLHTNIGGGTVNEGSWWAGDPRPYEILQYVTDGWNYGQGTLGHDTAYMKCSWWPTSTNWPVYTGSGNINVGGADDDAEDVLKHEYGHRFMDDTYGGFPPGSGGAHNITGHYTLGLAYSEGYATYFAAAAQNDGGYVTWTNPANGYTFDYDANLDGHGSANGNSDDLSNGVGNYGYDTESAVAAMLIDLEDPAESGTDPYDWADYSDLQVHNVYLQQYAGHFLYSVNEFIEKWQDYRGNEPKFNGQCMVHGMKQNTSTRPTVAISAGGYLFGGVWYWAGYGSAWDYIFNYGSQTINHGQIWAWLKGPSGELNSGGDLFLLEGAGSIASGAEKYCYGNNQHIFLGNGPLYGTYSIGYDWYGPDGGYRRMLLGESGTDNYKTVNVVADTTDPTGTTCTDEGLCMNPSSKTSISFTTHTTENESAVKGWWVQIGTSFGGNQLMGWTFYDAPGADSWSKTITGLTLPANQKIYVSAVARNYNFNGTDSFGYSDGIYAWDLTPPTGMSATDDGATQLSKTQLHFTATATETDGCLAAWWYRIYDEYGNIERNWTQVAGTDNLPNWNYTATGLSMTNGRTYYVQVAAQNMSSGADCDYGYATTNGIRIANPVTISGKITLQDAPGYSLAGKPVDVWVGSNTAGGVIYETATVTLDAAGNYSFTTTRTENLRIMFKRLHWLRKSAFVTVNPNTGLSGLNVSLKNGDCDTDNYVGTDDYLLLSKSFDTVAGGAGYFKYADLDESGYVNTDDYLILNKNFDDYGDN